MNRSAVQKLIGIACTLLALYLIAESAIGFLEDGFGFLHTLTPDLMQLVIGIVIWKLEPEIAGYLTDLICGAAPVAGSATSAVVAPVAVPAVATVASAEPQQGSTLSADLDAAMKQFEALQKQVALGVKHMQDDAAAKAAAAAQALAKAQAMGVPNAG